MKTKFAFALLSMAACAVRAAPKPTEEANGVTLDTSAIQAAAESPAAHDAKMQWWREGKFGLFIHWGVYSVPAGKYGDVTTHGEWIMHEGRIPVQAYRQYAQRFDPVKYDPVAWARLAREAGMRYIVITAKHHDGFALFPSQASHWNVVEATPYKRDLVGPLVDAAKAEGLRIGFYYSQSQDWNNPGGAKKGFPPGDGWDPAQKGSYDDYLAKTAVPQVREILTRYPIDIIWWDTPMFMTPQRAAPLAALTKLRPGLITNNRLGGGFPGDTATPEQFVPVTGIKGDWETCMTMNRHWGYNAYDHDWKSSAELIRKLAEVCSKGGNFLLNVGPTAEGEIPPPCVERLKEIGQWLRVNGDSIYGTSAGPFAFLSWGTATLKGDLLYLHVFAWPKDGKLRVPLLNDARQASLLADPGTNLGVHREPGRLVIDVPAQAPDRVDSVIALAIAGDPVVAPLPTQHATATASDTLAGTSADYVLDGTPQKIWRAAKETKSGWVEIDLAEPTSIGGFGFDEPDVWPRMKQTFAVQVLEGSGWRTIASGRTEGHGFKQSIAPVLAQKFRIAVTYPPGSPGIAEFQLYRTE